MAISESEWESPVNSPPLDINQFIPYPESIPYIEYFKNMARSKSLELLKQLEIYMSNGITHKICTSESLTAGLIMSTLVDIPRFGVFKYGCFGVYDTDAKRVFNHVSIDNVYTQECASQMAIGTLQNSNASIAIAVTGNAMPGKADWDKLGQVFFSVAKYISTNSDRVYNIKCTSWELNICNEINRNAEVEMPFNYANRMFNEWVRICKDTEDFPPGPLTATVSHIIRYCTVYFALNYCCQDIKQRRNAVYPDFLHQHTTRNNNTVQRVNGNLIHNMIPNNKYDDIKDDNFRVARNFPSESSLHYISYRNHNNSLRNFLGEFQEAPVAAPAVAAAAEAATGPSGINMTNSDGSYGSQGSRSTGYGGAAGKQRRKHIHRTYKRKHKK